MTVIFCTIGKTATQLVFRRNAVITFSRSKTTFLHHISNHKQDWCKDTLTETKMTGEAKNSAQDNFSKTIAENEKIMENIGIKEDEGFWLFGYGSLIWHANFEFEKSLIGHITGFKRCFWQGSKDHRGTPDHPGRVATLVPTHDQSIVWGRAYYIPPVLVHKNLQILNFREKGGYSLSKVTFTPRYTTLTEKKIDVLLYIAVEGNHDFLGEDCLDKMAEQIASSVGPSGPNYEYLLNLAKYLEENDMLTINDKKHTIVLRNKVEMIMNNNEEIK